MAALVGHLDQAGHHRAHPKPGLQHQQHRQAAHHVLAEGQHQRQRHLPRHRSPQPLQLGQGFAEQQRAEHQGEQHQRQIGP